MTAPPRFSPMLVGTGKPPAGDVVIEPKWDGVRSMVTVHDGHVRIRSSDGQDVTGCYPELIVLDAGLADRSAVFDGEIVAFDDAGRCSLQRLQQRVNRRQPSLRTLAETPVRLVVFDILWLDGDDLTGRPLSERRRILERLALGERWQLTTRLDGPLTPELLAACEEAGMEGVIVKGDGPYRPGVRTKDWVKIKFRRTALVVIGGVSTQRIRAGALAVGAYRNGALHYIGQVANSLPRAQAAQLSSFLGRLGQANSPFVDLAPAPVAFVSPQVVLEVSYVEVTAAGTMRQPVLVTVRPDVPASTVELDEEFAEVIDGGRGLVKLAARQRR